MNKNYLLPILAFFPLIIIIILLSRLEYDMSPLLVCALISTYLAANIIYSVIRGTFHISILVELTLISLIAYYILTSLI